MNLDFSLTKYQELCKTIIDSKYKTLTVEQYLTQHLSKPSIIVRHDVDRKAKNALRMAEIEKQFGIKSTYYFRTIKKVYKPEIIKKIIKMGHEIGYHYEVLAKTNGNFESAIKLFEQELIVFREIAPVKTICMHGSPVSKWKDSDLWEKFNFKDYGIIGEAFLSIDFNEVAYFTDTGRRWDGDRYNIRDKVEYKQKWQVRSTDELIFLFKSGQLKKVMITAHPQRWNDKIGEWIKELVGQNIKNVGKWMLSKWR